MNMCVCVYVHGTYVLKVAPLCVCENELYLLVVDITEFFECMPEQWLVD